MTRLQDDLNNANYVLLFLCNGTGKLAFPWRFKDAEKETFPAIHSISTPTEDLFSWDNDLQSDAGDYLRLNTVSSFFPASRAGVGKKFSYLERYADFDFKIDYEQWSISFSRGEEENIKISRGEENIFIWCIFLAICTLVIEGHESYAWVKYIYIDDPISSLDDNNAIAVATDLINTLKKPENTTKCIISSHHGLFFNVLWNEFKRSHTNYNTYFFYRSAKGEKYSLQRTDEAPFFHHVAMLSELQQAMESNQIYTHHFNALRSIMKKQPFSLATKIFHRTFMALMTKCCIHAPSIS